jgi:cysteinyl-tRNA synthetase
LAAASSVAEILTMIKDEGVRREIDGLVSQFSAAMDDDFNTPRALAALFDLGAVVNRQRDTADQASTEGSQASGTAAVEDLVRAGNVLWLLAGVLGLSGRGTEPNRQIKAVQDLVAEREAARRRRDWQLADQLRTRLLHEYNVIIEDTAAGPRLTVRDQ